MLLFNILAGLIWIENERNDPGSPTTVETISEGEKYTRTEVRSAAEENDEHGGSWFDDFDDENGMESKDNLSVNIGRAGLAVIGGGPDHYMNGSLISSSIYLTPGMRWDTLSINKVETGNSSISVTVIDSDSGNEVEGLDIQGAENINITVLNELNISSIKLQALWTGNGNDTAYLDSWGIEWIAENTWRDSFLGGYRSTFSDPSRGAYRGGGAQLRFNQLEADEDTSLLLRFDEGMGSETYDVSGNNNHGVINGTNWTDGQVDGALDFDGTDDFVEVPSSDSLNLNVTITLQVWVKTNSVASQVIISKMYTVDAQTQYQIQIRDDATLWFCTTTGAGGGGHVWGTTDPVYTADEWYFFTVTHTWGNPSNIRVYVNGQQVTGSWIVGNGSAVPPKSANPVTIGTHQHNIPRWFDGVIDEVAIHSRILSAGEILDQYSLYRPNTTLRSENVTRPPNCSWDEFHFNRRIPDNMYLNISLHDAVTDDVLYRENNHSEEETISLSELNMSSYSSIYLEAYLQSNATTTPVLKDWSVNWTLDEEPILPPSLTDDIPDINVTEDTPQQGIIDLTGYFNDTYSHISPSNFSIEEVSDKMNMTLSIDGSLLDVTYLAENWTGAVAVTVNCTNMHGLSALSNEFYVTVLNVNDPPVAELKSPFNGAILYETKIDLKWSVFDVDNDTGDIVFDLYFGTNDDPPLNSTKIPRGKCAINGLENGRKYYWYVLPDDGVSVGLCKNGPFNFTVDVNVTRPTLNLISPVKGTKVGNTTVNLSWSPQENWTGSALTFQVMTGTAPEYLTGKAVVNDTWYILEGLEYNETYYWTVIPHAGGVAGKCLDGTWNFSVEMGFVPVFNLSASIDKQNLVLMQGQTGSFNITVNNSGNVPAGIQIGMRGDLAIHMDYLKNHVVEIGKTYRIQVDIIDTAKTSIGIHSVYINVATPVQNLLLSIIINIIEGDGQVIPGDDDIVPPDDDDGNHTRKEPKLLPGWQLIVIGGGGLLLLIVAAVMFIVIRRRKEAEDEEFGDMEEGGRVPDELGEDESLESDSEDDHWGEEEYEHDDEWVDG